jgi:S1-C subfamily serine protease
MTLVPNADLDISDVNERSGMFVVHSGAFVVAGVRPGTPAADAGIVKGDTIVSIDGVPADRLTLGTMREAFRRPAATTIEVGVQSKGATSSRTITLTLRDYV